MFYVRSPILEVAQAAIHPDVRRGCHVATDEDDIPRCRHHRVQAVVSHPHVDRSVGITV